MVIAGVICLCAAVVSAGSGLWWFARKPGTDTVLTLRRAQAPIQLAAAVMLATGAAVALAAPRTAVFLFVICVAGAVGTTAVGSWQGARYASRRQAVPVGCHGACAACTRPCP
jgi:hypothetical protein